MEFYERLSGAELYKFQCHMQRELARVLAEEGEMSPGQFLEHVTASFEAASASPSPKEKKPKKASAELKEKPKPKAPAKKKQMKQKEITDYQRYEQEQLNLRKDEFKNMSAKDRHVALGHEYFAMSRDQRDEIIAKVGRLSV